MRRTTLRLIVVVVAVVALVPITFVLFGLSVNRALEVKEAGDEPDDSFGLGCVAARPDSVTELNQWLTRARTVGSDVGADVGASVELSDGRSMWVFGDTIRAAGAAGPTMVRNSALIVDDECVRTISTPDGGAVIPDAADGTGYWPVTIDHIAVEGGDRVAVGLFRVVGHGDGTWDFTTPGTALAEFWVPTGGTPELEQVVDVASTASDQTPAWGVAVVVRNRWIHVYGTSRPSDDSTGWALHVARLKLPDITDPTRWQYWDGRRWGDDPAASAAIIPADGGVSRVLTVFRRDRHWYAVSKRNDFLGTDLVIWKGDAPQGPFVATPAALQIPSTPDNLQYMALAHPHLLPEPGTVVVSWSRNGGGLDEIRAEPSRYRPVFARVPLP
ncbi:hypothetical protein [Nocardioides alcanivorans]|uniref:hypothetical protein n=1 Tax=Nocardioides alcanivorans TaxID=2897352 RepID=UPI001F25FEBE|nr:hypothetical protein [Nocardioides alcanivorans]